jgi:hypothetical protein
LSDGSSSSGSGKNKKLRKRKKMDYREKSSSSSSESEVEGIPVSAPKKTPGRLRAKPKPPEPNELRVDKSCEPLAKSPVKTAPKKSYNLREPGPKLLTQYYDPDFHGFLEDLSPPIHTQLLEPEFPGFSISGRNFLEDSTGDESDVQDIEKQKKRKKGAAGSRKKSKLTVESAPESSQNSEESEDAGPLDPDYSFNGQLPKKKRTSKRVPLMKKLADLEMKRKTCGNRSEEDAPEVLQDDNSGGGCVAERVVDRRRM